MAKKFKSRKTSRQAILVQDEDAAAPFEHDSFEHDEGHGAKKCAKDLDVLLKKHFEASFAPLEIAPSYNDRPSVKASLDEQESSGEEDNWEGLSDDDDSQPRSKPVVVIHDESKATLDTMPIIDSRSFMSAKPPLPITHQDTKSATLSSKRTRSSKNDAAGNDGNDNDDDERTEAANLRNDLALQRLLRESHLLERGTQAGDNGYLLSRPSTSTTDPYPTQSSHNTRTRTTPDTLFAPTGAARHRALDMRLQTLGSRHSLFSQQKMPLAQRQGIAAKAAQRESTRRREARENGIVLERKGKTTSARRRSTARSAVDASGLRDGLGVGDPSVGKFRGGMLRLSRRDVKEIHAGSGSGGSGSGSGGRGSGSWGGRRRGGSGKGRGR